MKVGVRMAELCKKMELSQSEEKNIVYKMIDMALVYSKTKKALAG